MKHIKSLFLAALLCLTTTVFAAYDGVPVTPEPITADNYPLYGLTASNYTDYLGKYVINDAAHLCGLAKYISEQSSSAQMKDAIYVVLTADIVVNENCLATIEAGETPAYEWLPICTYQHNRLMFFDGQGHTVSGLYFSNTSTGYAGQGGGQYVGLFGYLYGGRIENVGVKDSYMKGKSEVGGIVGYMTTNNASIAPMVVKNCYSEATMESDKWVGGIVGFASDAGSQIINCCNRGKVTSLSSGQSGGIGGYMQALTLKNCLNLGEVVSSTSYKPGAICYLDDAVVSNCYYLAGSAHRSDGTLLYGLSNTTSDVPSYTFSIA